MIVIAGNIMKNKKMITSNLKCTECNYIFPIPRFKNSLRERNHIKTLWCPYCKDYKKMKELEYY
jgi:uncharacterized protein YbaR (Trm112 family)